jgi:hypothetical protein
MLLITPVEAEAGGIVPSRLSVVAETTRMRNFFMRSSELSCW